MEAESPAPATSLSPVRSLAVESIGVNDNRFEQVIKMWGAERKTLGLFPVGAFETCAMAGHLLVASDAEGTVQGYLAYRVQRRLNCAVIIHLCVAKTMRGQHVSDILWTALKAEAKKSGWESIRLKCRRDYHAHQLWKRFGMVARADSTGRSQSGSELTLWVYKFDTEGFLDFAEDKDDDRLVAVMDANVFYDLRGKHGDRCDESKVLLEPWMEESVALCVVDELHNEIDRCEVREHREAYHREAQLFTELSIAQEERDAAYAVVLKILGDPGQSNNNRSDRVQVAKAAAAKADVFLTRDQKILDAAAEVERQLGLRVMSPGELSSKLDEAERAHVYRPSRLSGTDLTQRTVNAEDSDIIVSAFQAAQSGETKGELLRAIRAAHAQVRSERAVVLYAVWQHSDKPLAFFAKVVDSLQSRPTVHFLRTAKCPLECTLARHILLMLIRENSESGLRLLAVNDKHLSSVVIEALRELHFVSTAEGWHRFTPAVIGDRSKVITSITSSVTGSPQLSPGIALSDLSTAVFEEHFWPAKILGEGLQTFIVPILPTWAAQLFDKELAEGELFGAFARLALNRENVYYRRPKNSGLTAPGRILWYVCQDKTVEGTMAVRACSRLISYETGPAKDLYKRHQHLGIYEWREVRKTANDDAFGEIMVIRFADSETFARQISASFLETIGIKMPILSPRLISEEQFAAIYRSGMNFDPTHE